MISRIIIVALLLSGLAGCNAVPLIPHCEFQCHSEEDILNGPADQPASEGNY